MTAFEAGARIIDAKRATGRAKDAAMLPELEALAEAASAE
jgi:hypothetical protein